MAGPAPAFLLFLSLLRAFLGPPYIGATRALPSGVPGSPGRMGWRVPFSSRGVSGSGSVSL